MKSERCLQKKKTKRRMRILGVCIFLSFLAGKLKPFKQLLVLRKKIACVGVQVFDFVK